MKNKRILISGGGIAGLTLAYWLKRYGFEPVIVEQAKALRTGGYKVDIRGVALDVIKRMEIHDAVSARHTHIQGASIFDTQGKLISTLSGETFNLRESDDLEIIRGDLCQILKGLTPDTNCIFDDSVRAMTYRTDGIKVDFQKNSSQIFDLIVGADGLHSNIRNLAFGAESNFAKSLGMCISIFTIPNYLNLDRWEMECSEPGRLVNIYSTGLEANAKAAFLFTSTSFPRTISEQQSLLISRYSDMGWEVPHLLSALKQSPDFYFDSVPQIHMKSWSNGPVVLLGDAGYCASPVSGQGTSLALVGAYVLAGELAKASGDYHKAFPQYEKKLKAYVKKNQKLGQTFAKNMTSQNSLSTWVHEKFMSLLPGQWVNYLTNRSVKRVSIAANALSLQNYT